MKNTSYIQYKSISRVSRDFYFSFPHETRCVVLLKKKKKQNFIDFLILPTGFKWRCSRHFYTFLPFQRSFRGRRRKQQISSQSITFRCVNANSIKSSVSFLFGSSLLMEGRIKLHNWIKQTDKNKQKAIDRSKFVNLTLTFGGRACWTMMSSKMKKFLKFT